MRTRAAAAGALVAVLLCAACAAEARRLDDVASALDTLLHRAKEQTSVAHRLDGLLARAHRTTQQHYLHQSESADAEVPPAPAAAAASAQEPSGGSSQSSGSAEAEHEEHAGEEGSEESGEKSEEASDEGKESSSSSEATEQSEELSGSSVKAEDIVKEDERLEREEHDRRVQRREDQEGKKAVQELINNVGLGRHISMETMKVLSLQLEAVEMCYDHLYNLTVPQVLSLPFFPKNRTTSERRFRFDCHRPLAVRPEFGEADPPIPDERQPAALVSYPLDGGLLPLYVAFHMKRAEFGNAKLPHASPEECKKRGGAQFYRYTRNGIDTPDPGFLVAYNAKLAEQGEDPRSLLQRGQLCLPSHLLSCEGKQGTYSMTNVVPMNRYLADVNWAKGDEALRQYVAHEVPPAPRGREASFLASSSHFRPLYVVAGVHFSKVRADMYDFRYGATSEEDIKVGSDMLDEGVGEVHRGAIPHGVWLAAVDPRKVRKTPAEAAVAWYCENRPNQAWPDTDFDDEVLEAAVLSGVAESGASLEGGSREEGGEGGDSTEAAADADEQAESNLTPEQVKERKEQLKNRLQYVNGPKLCRVLSVRALEKLVGIRPFPDLPKSVADAEPNPMTWFLPAKDF